jgi:hypothetical protein
LRKIKIIKYIGRTMKMKFYSISAAVILALLVFQGCSEDPLPTLYDLATTPKPAPVVTAITPDEAIAVVTQITITGQNFSPVTEDNAVYFNGKPGTVLSSTETQLVVTSANVVSDTTAVKVRVKGAEEFSNTIRYKLTPVVAEVVNDKGDAFFTDLFKPNGIALDNNNNLYVSVVADGIKKITPAAVLTEFAPKGSESSWSSLKYGPAATLYGARIVRGVWRINEGVTPPTQPWVASPSIILDIDFDANQNVWGVGTNSMVRFSQTTNTAKAFPIIGTIRAVRIFDNAVYVAGNRNSIEGVWRFPMISADSLGSEELYFNFTAFDTVVSRINAITFSADGDLLIGTTRNPDPIIRVRQDKTAEVLYKGAIPANSEVLNFSWDNGNFLYFTRGENLALTPKIIQTVFKVNMDEPGAPYYGRN